MLFVLLYKAINAPTLVSEQSLALVIYLLDMAVSLLHQSTTQGNVSLWHYLLLASIGNEHCMHYLHTGVCLADQSQKYFSFHGSWEEKTVYIRTYLSTCCVFQFRVGAFGNPKSANN